MGFSAELSNLVVKRTFLEFTKTPELPSRARAFTDTELFDIASLISSQVARALPTDPVRAEGSRGGADGAACPTAEAWPGEASPKACQPAPEFPVTPLLAGAFPGAFPGDFDFEHAGVLDFGASRCDIVDLLATMEVKAVLGMDHPIDCPAACGPAGAEASAAEALEEPFHGQWMFVPCASFADCHAWAAEGMLPPQASYSSAALAESVAPGGGGGLNAFDFDFDFGFGGAHGAAEEDARATVMLRSLPAELTRDGLAAALDRLGFAGRYDLVYLPVNFSTGEGLGYAFVNMVLPSDVPQLWSALDGFTQWGTESDSSGADDAPACSVAWSEPNQGLAAHVDRYRNSPVMHADVPDGWKPALFAQGMRVDFPPPTKKLKAPKVRSKKTAAA